MITEEIRYITQDGKEFGTKDAAVNHENEIDFITWFDNKFPNLLEAYDMVYWLLRKDVKERILELWENEV